MSVLYTTITQGINNGEGAANKKYQASFSTGKSGLSFGQYQHDVAVIGVGGTRPTYDAFKKILTDSGQFTIKVTENGQQVEKPDLETIEKLAGKAATKGVQRSTFSSDELSKIDKALFSEDAKKTIDTMDKTREAFVRSEVEKSMALQKDKGGALDPSGNWDADAIKKLAAWANRTNGLPDFRAWLKNNPGATSGDIDNYLLNQRQFRPVEIPGLDTKPGNGENYAQWAERVMGKKYEGPTPIYYKEGTDSSGNKYSEKVIVEKDGVQKYHTDYDADSKKTGESNSYTKADGSVKYYEKRDADGNLTSTDLTETKKDGSKKETHMEYNPDGTVKSWKIKETAPNGDIKEYQSKEVPDLNDIPQYKPDIFFTLPPPEPPPPPPRDPLVLDLGGNGIITTGLTAGIHFDHDGDGFRELSGFVNSEDGLLVLDRNNDGKINDGNELFGDSTRLLDGEIAPHGFAALSEFDDDKDGVINKDDAVFDKLRIFQDLNQNGKADAGELFSLEEKKIAGLNLTYQNSPFIDKFGNAHRQLGTYVTEPGETRTMTDVVFAMNRTLTETDKGVGQRRIGAGL